MPARQNGILERRGLGKVRHVEVEALRHLESRHFQHSPCSIRGEQNCGASRVRNSDLGTKPLTWETIRRPCMSAGVFIAVKSDQVENCVVAFSLCFIQSSFELCH